MMRPLRRVETSGTKFPVTQRRIPEDRISHLRSCRNVISSPTGICFTKMLLFRLQTNLFSLDDTYIGLVLVRITNDLIAGCASFNREKIKNYKIYFLGWLDWVHLYPSIDVCNKGVLLMGHNSVLSVETGTGLTAFAINDQVITGSEIPGDFSVRLLYCKHWGIDFRENPVWTACCWTMSYFDFLF
jgi:hypothetical protein